MPAGPPHQGVGHEVGDDLTRIAGDRQTLARKPAWRIRVRMLAGHDFYEGIRAAIVDKGSKPRWRPDSLDAVDAADVESYFAPLPEGDLAL